MQLGLSYVLDAKVHSVRTVEECQAILPYIVRSINMTPVGSPVVLPHPWGPSGWQMMSESHIAFDYFYMDSICIDLFSCNPFDEQVVKTLLVAQFDIDEDGLVERLFHRGFKDE